MTLKPPSRFPFTYCSKLLDAKILAAKRRFLRVEELEACDRAVDAIARRGRVPRYLRRIVPSNIVVRVKRGGRTLDIWHNR